MNRGLLFVGVSTVALLFPLNALSIDVPRISTPESKYDEALNKGILAAMIQSGTMHQLDILNNKLNVYLDRRFAQPMLYKADSLMSKQTVVDKQKAYIVMGAMYMLAVKREMYYSFPTANGVTHSVGFNLSNSSLGFSSNFPVKKLGTISNGWTVNFGGVSSSLSMPLPWSQ